jgi:hypothetical protein
MGNAVSEASIASYIPPSGRPINQRIRKKRAATVVVNRRQREKQEISEEACEESSRWPLTNKQKTAKNRAKKVAADQRQEVLIFKLEPAD